MAKTTMLGTVLVLSGLAGCVPPPPPQPPLQQAQGPQQVPFVAVPGPTKTEAQFHQDDTTCRAMSVQFPPGPGANTPAYRPVAGSASASGSAQGTPPAGAEPEMPAGVAYLRCMAVRNNVIQPLASAPPPLYAYYPAYPVFVGFGYPYPFLYDGLGFGFGFGFGFGGGFGGGFGRYDRGFREGGFREGEFRGGGFGGYGGGGGGEFRGGGGGGEFRGGGGGFGAGGGGGFHGGGGGFGGRR